MFHLLNALLSNGFFVVVKDLFDCIAHFSLDMVLMISSNAFEQW